VWLPHRPGEWPTGTWLVNVSGCLLIGVLMTVLSQRTAPHRLVRPFLGVGVLGGYTTFSTAMVEAHELGDTGRAALAFAYLLGSVTAALLATAAGAAAVRAWDAGRGRRRPPRREGP
jgi:CrcB protein